MQTRETIKKIVDVNVMGGPAGSCGFRTGMWVATTSDGRKFEFYASVSHCADIEDQRTYLINQAQKK